MSYTQRTIVLDVFFQHDLTDDESQECADCGDQLYREEPKVSEPAPEVSPKACYITHAWCAVRNGYQLRWASK